ncbi:MAG: hypothetical protein CMJ06_01505 [Pelagibacterales bacterium]|nr:hypothetical protein [Pelagibacterales bacterium]OUU63337.1 MAG: hypothetical protein CBC22_01475 [Alphaproteobacteria bacterium TMED62]|tara:strand:+ start:1356 stop:3104 length:1749 start_codon:yes stop_codon:yes gene_type:complete
MLKFIYILLYIFIAFNSLANVIEQGKNNHLLPKVLSYKDIELYKNAEAYQNKYEWEKADLTLLKVKNDILVGHFEYEKLMHPNKYRASYEELSQWFKTNTNYPPVLRKRIYKLLKRRLPDKENLKLYEKPLFNNYLRGYGEDNYFNYYVNSPKNINKKDIQNTVSTLINDKKDNALINIVNQQNNNKSYFIYSIHNEIKKTFFSGKLKESQRLYDFYIKALNITNPNIFYRAGINAYRLGDFKKSRNYFTECNRVVQNFQNWLLAGCSYWRALLESSKRKEIELLKRASNLPRTLYGQLAIEKLNISDPFIWKNNINDGKVNFSDLNKNKLFRRAIALTEVGLYNHADIEIRNLYSKTHKEELNNLFYASEKLALPAVLIRLGSKYHKKNFTLYMRGLYPTPNWQIKNGFKLDKALLFALIRRESAFNFKAKSSKGARGLMQIMPRTASKINNDYRLRYSKAYTLYSLQLNIEIGQKLLKRLINSSHSKNSILDALIAYNAGMTRLKKWKKNIGNVEPIVFIESIPIKETRWFVKYILTDLWIYRDKLQQAKPSRALLADGKYPTYINLDYEIIQDAKFRRK